MKVTMFHDKGSLGRKTGGKCWILEWVQGKIGKKLQTETIDKERKG